MARPACAFAKLEALVGPETIAEIQTQLRYRLLNFFGRCLAHLGEPTSPPRPPARGPRLWEIADAVKDRYDPQAHPGRGGRFLPFPWGRLTRNAPLTTADGDETIPEVPLEFLSFASGRPSYFPERR
jgi:hypothetical protein